MRPDSRSAIGAALVTTALLVAIGAPRTVAGDAPGHAPPRPFEEFLAGMEFVAHGTLLGYEELFRSTLGGCGDTVQARFPCTDYRVRVTSVLAGVAEDTIIVVSSTGRPRSNRGLLNPGTSVLVWGVRSCSDSWRLWGGVAGINDRNYLFPITTSSRALVTTGESTARPSSYTRLEEKWVQMGARVGTNVLKGAPGVALVRLDAVQSDPNAFSCTFVRWIIDGDCTPPTSVVFNPGPDCLKEVVPGDSVAIPVSCSGATQTVTACPRALRVDHEFMPGLSVPVEFASYALRTDEHGVQVKQFVSEVE